MSLKCMTREVLTAQGRGKENRNLRAEGGDFLPANERDRREFLVGTPRRRGPKIQARMRRLKVSGASRPHSRERTYMKSNTLQTFV